MQKKQKDTTLIWFRNDLRTIDNVVLAQACKRDKSVIAVYCFDPKYFEMNEYGFRVTQKYRAKFLIETIQDLKTQLSALNIDLLVFNESPESILPKICESYDVSEVYLQNEWTRDEMATQTAVVAQLQNVQVHTVYNQFLYDPEDINFEIEKLPQVFTVFRKKLEKELSIHEEVCVSQLAASNRIKNTTQIPSLEDLGFENFERHPHSAFPFKGGETEALKRLEEYFFETKKLGFYKKTRNGLVGKDYSSKFSSWLANGSLSARTIYAKVKQFEKEYYSNESTYWLIFELIWRDYFKYVSMKHGNQIFKLKGILNKEYDWMKNQEQIDDWINGRTDSDFVNANMIELKETGWMSNRGRQNVASYFAKELKLDWRIGAAYFESLLIDYDVHSNYRNWMYVAGVGNDPRDRKFNVKLQADRYDGSGKFRKIWLEPSLF